MGHLSAALHPKLTFLRPLSMVITEDRFPSPLNGHHSMYVYSRKNRVRIAGIHNELRLNTHGTTLEQLVYSGPNGNPTKFIYWRWVLLERSDDCNVVDTGMFSSTGAYQQTTSGLSLTNQIVMRLIPGVSQFTVMSTKQGMSPIVWPYRRT
jgi:hypothetical protein